MTKNQPTCNEEPISQSLHDWLVFFKEAHLMTEEDVKNRIKTPAVLLAFERVKISNLPPDVLKEYNEEVEAEKLLQDLVEKHKETLEND